MITPSETARRAENPTAIAPADERSQERYMLRDLARERKPKCIVCGCLVRSSKAKEKRPRCDLHENVELSKTDQRHLGKEENRSTYLPGLAHERQRRKISRREIYQRCGVAAETQKRIERGGGTKIGTARKLALALGVEVRELEGER